MDIFPLTKGFHGNQVPSVMFGDPSAPLRTGSCGDKVHVINTVVSIAIIAADHSNSESVISMATGLETGLHLHAQQALAVLGEEVVGKAVAVGLGDSDAVAGGAIHESQFGQFSHALAGEWPAGRKALREVKVGSSGAELLGNW